MQSNELGLEPLIHLELCQFRSDAVEGGLKGLLLGLQRGYTRNRLLRGLEFMVLDLGLFAQLVTLLGPGY